MSYTYVVTSQKATSIHHAKMCHFTDPDAINLVVAMGNRIEVKTLTPENLILDVDFSIYGTIVSLDSYRTQGTHTDVLFVVTEKKQFAVLAYDREKQKIITKATG